MVSKKMKLHVLEVVSESTDHFGPFLFRKRIDGQELLDFLKEHVSEMDCEEVEKFDPNEDAWSGPGWAGTYLHLTWSKQEVM